MQTKIKKRRTWLAALLSLVLPGLGQLYNRDVRMALPLMAAVFLFPFPSLWLIAGLPASAGFAVMIVVLVGLFALVGFAILQAAILSRRIGYIPLAWFNRWYVYLGLYLLFGIWQTGAQLLPIASVAAYNISSRGMTPTLLIGDRLEARTKAFVARLPIRGEIAIFKYPRDQTTHYAQRVIGLPGDRIQLREGRLYVNSARVDRVPLPDQETVPLPDDSSDLSLYRESLVDGASYVIAEQGDDGPYDDTPEYVVPPEQVFVLGDNRDNSSDSRASVGFVPIALLRDKPLFIYWSRDLSRIGNVVQ